MSNKESKKVPINRDRFNETKNYRQTSIRKLAPKVDRDEKTIRRSLKDGRINPDVLDRIGRQLDVDPDFLSGKYDWPLYQSDDEQFRALYKAICLQPENYPYSYHLQDKTDYRSTLENTLALHGVSFEDLLHLQHASRTELDEKLDTAITRVLRQFFPDAKRCDRYFDFRRPSNNLREINEYLLDDLADAGVAEASWDKDPSKKNPLEIKLEKKYNDAG